MEKVVVLEEINSLSSYKVDRVNEELNNGWTVKSVTMQTTNDYITAIFVLQKD